MDDADRAQAREALDLELAMREHRRRYAELFEGDEHCMTPLDCHQCGCEIPEARRQAVPGTYYCVDCQTAHEARARGYA